MTSFFEHFIIVKTYFPSLMKHFFSSVPDFYNFSHRFLYKGDTVPETSQLTKEEQQVLDEISDNIAELNYDFDNGADEHDAPLEFDLNRWERSHEFTIGGNFQSALLLGEEAPLWANDNMEHVMGGNSFMEKLASSYYEFGRNPALRNSLLMQGGRFMNSLMNVDGSLAYIGSEWKWKSENGKNEITAQGVAQLGSTTELGALRLSTNAQTYLLSARIGALFNMFHNENWNIDFTGKLVGLYGSSLGDADMQFRTGQYFSDAPGAENNNLVTTDPLLGDRPSFKGVFGDVGIEATLSPKGSSVWMSNKLFADVASEGLMRSYMRNISPQMATAFDYAEEDAVAKGAEKTKYPYLNFAVGNTLRAGLWNLAEDGRTLEFGLTANMSSLWMKGQANFIQELFTNFELQVNDDFLFNAHARASSVFEESLSHNLSLGAGVEATLMRTQPGGDWILKVRGQVDYLNTVLKNQNGQEYRAGSPNISAGVDVNVGNLFK